MGLKKAKTYDNGVEAPESYTRIAELRVQADGTAFVIVYTYLDKVKSDSNAPPIGTESFTYTVDSKTQYADLFKEFYKLLKADPEFEGAEDVLD